MTQKGNVDTYLRITCADTDTAWGPLVPNTRKRTRDALTASGTVTGTGEDSQLPTATPPAKRAKASKSVAVHSVQRSSGNATQHGGKRRRPATNSMPPPATPSSERPPPKIASVQGSVHVLSVHGIPDGMFSYLHSRTRSI